MAWELVRSMISENPVQFEQCQSQARGERRVIVALIAVFWVAFQVIFYVYGVLAQDEVSISPGELLVRIGLYIVRPSELTIVAAGAFICFLVYLSLRQVRRWVLPGQLVVATVAAMCSAACFALVITAVSWLFHAPWPPLTGRFFVVDTLRWFAPFGLWAGVALAVTYNSEARERERRFALLQAQAQDAQMRALRYQVNPHLLYNTLNSIAALILARKNDLAEAMLLRLASFFRASLSNDPHSDVPLADEIALQKLYLEIEQMRFPNLTSDFAVPEELGQIRVPSLILQPLIENVLKHGTNPNRLPTHLVVSACERGQQLVIEIADNGPGSSTNSGAGVGLSNVRNRLKSRFGSSAVLETESRLGRGFRVRMTIPLHA